MAVDYAGYENQRRNIETGYAANVAANQYGRHVAQQRGSRQVGDLAQGFQRGWPKQASQWSGRGARAGMKSGFYQQAMQRYLGDYQKGRNDLMQGLADEQTQFGQNDARLAAERERALADLEAQKQREIALLAQNIAAVRPLV